MAAQSSDAQGVRGTLSAGAARPRVDYERLLRVARELLEAIGEDPDREGLRDTPRRYASLWREFIEYDPGAVATTFESLTVDQMVVVSGMRVWSFCEHHLLPFYCDVTVGCIVSDRVLGLSKFARIARKNAHRLQLQERLSHQIADEVQELLGTEDVAVVCRGGHLCMAMRGVRTDATMTSSVLRGAFAGEGAARSEFLQLALAPASKSL